MTTTKSGMTDLLWVMAQGHACPIANERYAWAVAEITGLRQKVAQLIDEASYADLRASGGITGDVAQPQEATETLAGIIASIPADLNWLIGKGKTRPDEPPFGVQLLRGLKIVAETEGDDICETIKAALALTRPQRSCQHDWRDIDSQSENSVRCSKCEMPGERQRDGSVYWPAT